MFKRLKKRNSSGTKSMRKKLKRNADGSETKRKIWLIFTCENCETMRNRFRFASFRFRSEKKFEAKNGHPSSMS